MGNRVLLMTPDRDWVESLMFALAEPYLLDGIYLSRDAAGALRLGSHHDPDVIIVDGCFGEGVVAEVIRELRRELTPALYILLTDEEDTVARRQVRAVGARDYLPRGLGEPHLARFIHHLQGTSRRPVPAARPPAVVRPAAPVAVNG